MTKACARCGRNFETQRSWAKYCSDPCRKRTHRGASITPIAKQATVVVGVHAAALAELTEANRQTSSRGQAALRLAERLDSATADTGSSVAAVAREFNAAMDSALAGATKTDDPLDELALRRKQRLAGA